MPARVDLIVHYTNGDEDAYNVFSYYSAAAFSNPTDMALLADAFETNVIADWVDFMPDDVNFVDIVARSPSYPFPVTHIVGDNGNVTADPAEYMPSWLPLNLKKVISGNLDGDTGLPYTGLRPVRYGRVFISWMLETFNSAAGFVVPGDATGTAWAAFINGLNDSVLISGNTWLPVVAGEALPAAGSLPARPSPVMGQIASFSPQYFTKLTSRRG